MALSVLEKKFNDLEPLARTHSSGIEEGSTDRGPYDVSFIIAFSFSILIIFGIVGISTC